MLNIELEGNIPLYSPNSLRSQLVELMTNYFPQYGPIKFYTSPVVSSNGGQKGFQSCVILFGVPLHVTSTYETADEADEAVARIAVSVIQEYLRIMKEQSSSAPMLSPVFEQLQKDFDSYRATNFVTNEVEDDLKAKGGHPSVHSNKDFEPTVKEKVSVMGPVITTLLSPNNPNNNSTSNENNSNNKKTKPPSIESSTPAAPPKALVPMNPVSLLHQIYQKKSQELKAPVIESIQGKGMWGAMVEFSGRKVVIKAVYREKKAAIYEAARRLCIELMDCSSYSFEIKRPDLDPDCDPEVKDFSVATTIANSTLDISNTEVEPVAVMFEKPASADNSLPEWISKDDIPQSPLNLPLINGKTYVSIVNEFCQRNRIASPDYVEMTGNKSLSMVYLCGVKSFEGSKFISFSFGKKKEAKEDCAMRIFQYLRNGNILDENGVSTGKKSKTQSNTASTSAIPPPPIPLPHMMQPPVPFFFPPPPPSSLPPNFGMPGNSEDPNTARLPPAPFYPNMMPHNQPYFPSPPHLQQYQHSQHQYSVPPFAYHPYPFPMAPPPHIPPNHSHHHSSSSSAPPSNNSSQSSMNASQPPMTKPSIRNSISAMLRQGDFDSAWHASREARKK